MENCLIPDMGGPECSLDKGILTALLFSEKSVAITLPPGATLAGIEALLKAPRPNRLFPIIGDDPTPAADEIIEETGTASNRKVRTKSGGFTIHFIKPSPCRRRKVLMHDDKKGFAFYIYSSGYIEGRISADGTTLSPYPVYLRAEKNKGLLDTTEKANLIVYSLQPDFENLTADGFFPTDFSATELEGVTNVTLKATSPAANTVHISAVTCSKALAEGLVAAGDWLISTAAGALVTVTPTYNSVLGVYVFSDPLLVTGTSYSFAIAPASAQTSDLKMESVAPVTIAVA